MTHKWLLSCAAAALTLTLANTTTQFAPDTWACARAAPGSSHQGTDKPCQAARRRSHLATGCDERSNPLAVSFSIALISSSRAALAKEDQECSLKRVAPQGYFCRFY